MDPTSVAATLAFAGAYTAVCAFWPERKRRAWIITTIAAATASLSSLPFVFDLVKARMNVGVLAQADGEGWRQQHALRTCSIFQGYLAADLLVGVVHYRDQITLLTGWVHHAVYIYIMQRTFRHTLPSGELISVGFHRSHNLPTRMGPNLCMRSSS